MYRALAILLLMLGLRLEAAVAVVNAQVQVGDLTVERVRDMLLGRIATWQSGQAVVIVLCTAEPGEQAVSRICARSVGLLQRGWKRLVFSGTGAMPLVADTQSAAMELVARTPGAITVLSGSPSAGDAQVITLIGGTPAGAR